MASGSRYLINSLDDCNVDSSSLVQGKMHQIHFFDGKLGGSWFDILAKNIDMGSCGAIVICTSDISLLQGRDVCIWNNSHSGSHNYPDNTVLLFRRRWLLTTMIFHSLLPQ